MSSEVIFHGIRISEQSPKAAHPNAELWGMTRANQRYWSGQLLDWDRWFDQHDAQPSGLWPGLNVQRAQTLDWYSQEPAGGRPIYMLEKHPDVPASVAFPLERVQWSFPIVESDDRGREPNRMFGCTLDYLFALALDESKRRIYLNGIGHADDPGHQYVHRTILYWLGFARGRGVEVLIDDPDPVFAAERPLSCYRNAGRKLYGYEVYGYDDLDAILRFFGQAIPDDDPDLSTLRALSADWRINSRAQPTFYADELDHLLTALQRRSRLAAIV